MRRPGFHLRARLLAYLAALIVIAFIAAALTGGCTSNLYLASNNHPTKPSRKAELVFVSNPDQQPEFDILRGSGIYRLTVQTNDVALLTLKPLGHGGGCGLGLLTTIYTLGIIPASLPARLSFNYEIEQSGTTNSYAHMLPVYERYSLWELFFKPFKSEKRTLAKALARSERSGLVKEGAFVEAK
jgi:hypothetical protein